MNPDTNELRHFNIEEWEKLKKEGFEPVPDFLEHAAKLKLGKKKSVFVSKTSGGKLSKWAAKKRRERVAHKTMVDKCNEYYSNDADREMVGIDADFIESIGNK